MEHISDDFMTANLGFFVVAAKETSILGLYSLVVCTYYSLIRNNASLLCFEDPAFRTIKEQISVIFKPAD